MSFTVPGLGGTPTPEKKTPTDLPEEVTAAIEESVKRFEQKFNGFGMLTMARTSGWIDEFRREIENVARLARAK